MGHQHALVPAQHQHLPVGIVVGGLALEDDKDVVFVRMGVERVLAALGVALDGDGHTVGLGEDGVASTCAQEGCAEAERPQLTSHSPNPTRTM